MMQQIYFVVGVAGIALGVALAIAAIVFFFVADIRGVLADLSGKARQADIKEREEKRRSRRARKALTNDQEWQGDIVEGDLRRSARSADAVSDGEELTGEPDEDDTATRGAPARAGGADGVAAVPASVGTAETGGAATTGGKATTSPRPAPAFVLVRSAVMAHSPNVIDGNGNEVPAS